MNNMIKKRKQRSKRSTAFDDQAVVILPGDGKVVAASIGNLALRPTWRVPKLKLSTIVTNFQVFTTGTIAGSAGQLTFSVGDVFSLHPALNSMFDQYRILGVEVLFRNATANLDSVLGGRCLTAIDFDSRSVPGSALDMNQYSTLVGTSVKQNHSRKFVPRCLNFVYNTASSSAYSLANPGMWNNCGYPNVPHYGLLYWIDPVAVMTYAIDVKYDIEFQNSV